MRREHARETPSGPPARDDRRARVGRDDRPGGPVPLFEQGATGRRRLVVADGEATGCARARHAEQLSFDRATRARNRGDRPARSVPMLGQRTGREDRSVGRCVRRASNGEAVRRTRTRNAAQLDVGETRRIGTGHNRPGRSVPLFDQRLGSDRRLRLRAGDSDREQLVVLADDTPNNCTSGVLLGFGLATTVQLAPLHRSMNVPLEPSPTAKQSDAVADDTAASPALGGPGGLTLGTTNHRGAALDAVEAVASSPVTSAIADNDPRQRREPCAPRLPHLMNPPPHPDHPRRKPIQVPMTADRALRFAVCGDTAARVVGLEGIDPSHLTKSVGRSSRDTALAVRDVYACRGSDSDSL